MDKNTLSNYGWIVIAVLVLSVMIALATPFGQYVEQGVRSTTTGLFDTSEKAMNVVGMSAGSGNFDDGYTGVGSGESSKPEQNEPQEPTADNLFGVWVFNESIDTNLNNLYEYTPVNFSLNGEEYIGFGLSDTGFKYVENEFAPDSPFIPKWDGSLVYTTHWIGDDVYRTVDFGTEGQSVSADFFTWLTANAIYQGGSVGDTETETPSESEYTLSGIWTFNEYPSISAIRGTEQLVNFVSNNNNFTSINVYRTEPLEPGNFVTSPASDIMYYDNENIFCNGDATGDASINWSDVSYQTINFGSTEQEVSQEFYEWFTANATYQG